MQITVFTPTFNRVYILPKLYHSLKNQKSHEFEWLIIDDGSTDETELIVKQFITDADFTIKYYKQTNQGKHIAINLAILKAKGDYILTIDSDDFLAPNCIEVCQNLISEIEDKKYFVGFTFLWMPKSVNEYREEYNFKKWTNDENYECPLTVEMNFVIKREILKKFPFPVFKGETFCQESLQLNRILKSYKILFTDHILAYGDYLEDGLSQNLYARLLKNPRYAMLSLKTKLYFAKTKTEKLHLAANYWDIALKTNQPIFKTFINFPLGLSARILYRKMTPKLFT